MGLNSVRFSAALHPIGSSYWPAVQKTRGPPFYQCAQQATFSFTAPILVFLTFCFFCWVASRAAAGGSLDQR